MYDPHLHLTHLHDEQRLAALAERRRVELDATARTRAEREAAYVAAPARLTRRALRRRVLPVP